MHVVILQITPISIHSFQNAQIITLHQNRFLLKVFPKYANYADVLLFDLSMELFKNTIMNKYAMQLVKDKQSPYLAYLQSQTSKNRGFNNLHQDPFENKVFLSLKSPAEAPILFHKKPDSSLYLYINYQGFNNLTMKNQYLLSLIEQSFDQLERAKRFI